MFCSRRKCVSPDQGILLSIFWTFLSLSFVALVPFHHNWSAIIFFLYKFNFNFFMFLSVCIISIEKKNQNVQTFLQSCYRLFTYSYPFSMYHYPNSSLKHIVIENKDDEFSFHATNRKKEDKFKKKCLFRYRWRKSKNLKKMKKEKKAFVKCFVIFFLGENC